MSQGIVNIDRRGFLKGLGVVGAGVAGAGLYGSSAAHALAPRPVSAPAGRVSLWNDPSSWPNGKVPGKGDIAVVDRPILLSGVAEVAGVRIEPTGTLQLAPTVTSWLRSSGNVVVRGALVLRPASAEVEHKITFVGIDETRFVGGHAHAPIDGDVGLWVTENGILDAAGSTKKSWTNLVDGVTKGSRKLVVRDATGWRVGDRIAITPTVAPDPNPKSDAHARAYDEVTITAISGTTITIDKALANPHPVAADSYGNRWTAEVLNLSRNVVIEGTASGRAHVIFLHTMQPQQLSDIELRHVGPRESWVNDNGKRKMRGVKGRYALHFHMNGDHSRGTVVRNVVVHDAGNHSFVPHTSHGVTFEGCVSHNTWSDPFWWDVVDRGDKQEDTNDITYRGCVASLVNGETGSPEAYRMTGFHLGKGEPNSNVAIDCVAVGIGDGNETSGFQWPELSRGIWEFNGCLAHNNVMHGILSWQNTEDIHVIRSFGAYHNGVSGIAHGAYSNFWLYEDCDLYANRYSGLEIHAVTRQTKTTKRYYKAPYPLLTFRRFRIDGGGTSTYGITSEGHRLPAEEGVPVLVADTDVRGATTTSFRMGPWDNREEYEIVDCRFDGVQFQIDSKANPTSHARVRNLNGEGKQFAVWPTAAGKGTAQKSWNAVVRTL